MGTTARSSMAGNDTLLVREGFMARNGMSVNWTSPPTAASDSIVVRRWRFKEWNSPKVYLKQPSYLEVFWLFDSVGRRDGKGMCECSDCFDFYYVHQLIGVSSWKLFLILPVWWATLKARKIRITAAILKQKPLPHYTSKPALVCQDFIHSWPSKVYCLDVVSNRSSSK